MTRRIGWQIAVLAAAVATAGCGASPSTPPGSGGGTAGPTGSVTVFAAASLKNTFTTLGHTFESENPGLTVTFTFAGSADLVTQLTNGAAADVFAAADTKNMDKLIAAGLAGGPVAFARNTLVIVTPPGNPSGIAGFADLARPDVAVVVCVNGVPCGTATAAVEAATGVTLNPVSEEQSVTDVLTKVETAEADAGLVYVTDARAAGDTVVAVPFPESAAAVNTYPIATLAEAENPAAAAAFVALVTGAEGRAVLAAAGFAAA